MLVSGAAATHSMNVNKKLIKLPLNGEHTLYVFMWKFLKQPVVAFMSLQIQKFNRPTDYCWTFQFEQPQKTG